jgi:CBS domain-containing protein
MLDMAAPDSLARSERRALRRLLLAATAAADRSDPGFDLDALTAAASIADLPAAAALHRVAGSVYRALEHVPTTPPDVSETLNSLRWQAAARHLLASQTLVRVGDALDSADISWLVMKGPAVASLLYGHPGDRSYGDLDLLIDRSRLADAVPLLEDLGFSHSVRNWALAEAMGAGEFTMSNGTVMLDVHWHLLYSDHDRRPYSIDPDSLLERARRTMVAGRRVPVLDPTDTLLALAFHATRSDGHRLIWSKDIERSLAVDRPDLDELVRRARAFSIAPPVGLALCRSRVLLGADVPLEVERSLLPDPVRRADQVLRTLAHPIQFHERLTVTRWFTRSVKSSIGASIAHLPLRARRTVAANWFTPAPNETDDPDEKSRFLQSVARQQSRA